MSPEAILRAKERSGSIRRSRTFLTADETDDSDLPAILNMENAGLVYLSAEASSEDLDRLSLEQAISLLKADRKVYFDLKKQGRADTAGFRLHLQAEEPLPGAVERIELEIHVGSASGKHERGTGSMIEFW